MTIRSGGCANNPNLFKILYECWEKLEYMFIVQKGTVVEEDNV